MEECILDGGEYETLMKGMRNLYLPNETWIFLLLISLIEILTILSIFEYLLKDHCSLLKEPCN